MRTAWYVFVLLCAASNAIRDGYRFYSGAEADTFVWVACIFFSISVAVECFVKIVGRPETA